MRDAEAALIVLYRGVNKILDEQNGGFLLPLGSVVEVTPLRDGRIHRDGRFRRVPCESNTARAHQIDTGLYGGCGVSTSRSEDRAIFFATSGRTENGFVYVIDESRLAEVNVSAYEFSDPIYPHEQEVTLIERSGGALPQSIILDKYEVDHTGQKQA